FVSAETSRVARLLPISSAARHTPSQMSRQLTTAIRIMCISCLPRDSQQSGGVFVINLSQNRLAQAQAVNPPAALRSNRCGRVIEVFILGFQKPVIDLVEGVAKRLLWRTRAGAGVGSEHDAVLISVEKTTRRPRLAPQFPDTRCDIDVHVGMAVQALRNVC